MPTLRTVSMVLQAAIIVGSIFDAVPARTQASADAGQGLIVFPSGDNGDALFRSAPSSHLWTSLITESATQNGIPPDLLLRLLQQESSLFTLAVSRTGAQGIAQFMPHTASARGLDDPFDPEKAIPAAARYVNDLRNQFGNLGLACAAYNAGPGRISEWLSGGRELPQETQSYVMRITGRSAADWTGRSAMQISAPSITVDRHPNGFVRNANKTSPETQLCEGLQSGGQELHRSPGVLTSSIGIA